MRLPCEHVLVGSTIGDFAGGGPSEVVSMDLLHGMWFVECNAGLDSTPELNPMPRAGKEGMSMKHRVVSLSSWLHRASIWLTPCAQSQQRVK